nr:MAG TPA: Enhancer of rudimentary-like protein [Caudoviricetes sp.]
MFRLLEFGRCDSQRLFLCHERRWIMRNLFQRADNAVRNVAGRIRSAFSRGGSRSSGS